MKMARSLAKNLDLPVLPQLVVASEADLVLPVNAVLTEDVPTPIAEDQKAIAKSLTNKTKLKKQKKISQPQIPIPPAELVVRW